MTEQIFGVGIDLGTSNSSVCKVDMSTGTPLVKFAKDLAGPQITSAVHIDTNGNWTFGSAAELISRNPVEAPRVISNFKLLLRGNSDIEVPGAAPVKPEELMRGFLAYLKECYEKTFHEPCERAVITVPASEDFDVDYRQRIRNAVEGRDQGGGLFSTFSTLPEPDAALRAFADLSEFVGKTLLVFDMGGGTLDVTVRKVTEVDGEIKLEHRAISGSPAAGVRVTQALTHHLLDEWQAAAGFTFSSVDRERAVRMNHFPVDDAKQKLSSVSLQQGMDSLAPIQFRIDYPTRTPGYFTTNVTAQKLTELSTPICDEAIATVEKALGDAGLMPSDIDAYFAVGGSVGLPLMAAKLKDFFGGRLPSTTMGAFGAFDAANAVAQGAAFHDLLRADGDGHVPSTGLEHAGVIEQKQPYAVSLVVDDHRKTQVLVPRGASLPYPPERRTFSMPVTDDNLDIVLVRGEGDPAHCEPLARRTIWFDSQVRQGAEISVSWHVTEGGELEIRAFDPEGRDVFVMVQEAIEEGDRA